MRILPLCRNTSPFLDGKYSVAPGLSAMAKADARDRLVFQLDEDYAVYLDNKNSCRKEDIHKYYLESALPAGTIAAVNQFLVNQFAEEYPAEFVLQEHSLYNKKTGETLQWREDWVRIDGDTYLSLFDALCSQVQEDVAICQLDGERDWLAAIHLSAPNHWSPAEKIGKPFGDVHGPVPGMEKLNQQYFKMLVTAVQKGPFFPVCLGYLYGQAIEPSSAATTRSRQHLLAGPEDRRKPGDRSGRRADRNATDRRKHPTPICPGRTANANRPSCL